MTTVPTTCSCIPRTHMLDPSTPLKYPDCLLAAAALMAYPVVVFIHGESFEWGSSSLYDGSVLAALGKVIVVTSQLSSRHSGCIFVVSKNVGYSSLPLHWAQENIVRFGGDPGEVTVMGHGTGAACLNYLVISPAATGQSVMNLNNLLVQLKTSKFQVDVGPSIDGVTIKPDWKNHMRKMGKEGRTPVDLLLGMTAANPLDILSQQEVQEGFDANYREDLLRSFVVNNYRYYLQEIMLAITAEYTDWSRSLHQPISIRDSTGQGLHDANIVSPMADLAKQLYTTSRSSYLYVLEEEVSKSGNESIFLNELVYVFGGPLGALGPLTSSYNFTKMDVTLSKSFISMWSNFIKLGHPKDTVSKAKMSERANDITSEEQIWPKYDPVYQRYFQIGEYNFTEGFISSPITPTFTGPTNTPHNLTIVAKANKNHASESANLYMLSQMGKDFPYTTALSVTVAIACSLLVLNILVLTTVYYRHKANHRCFAKGSQDVNNERGNDVQLHSSGDNCKTIYGPEHYGTLRPSITMCSNLATAFEEEPQHDWPPDYISSVQTIDDITGVTSNKISPDTQSTITNTQMIREPKENILTVTTLKQPVASYTSPNDGQLFSTYSSIDGQLVPTYSTKENQLVQNYSPSIGQQVISYSSKDGQLIPYHLSSGASTMHIWE
ncbi:neuroligin-4, Y-linked-like [Palaemon carinicauda]|uniref:neuroligin-4, Y-linked-like n=1 Tax=Palaemon carinicauda TaxID=392227 RepID=UPI0035B5DDF0